jgi:hypothetical protein
MRPLISLFTAELGTWPAVELGVALQQSWGLPCGRAMGYFSRPLRSIFLSTTELGIGSTAELGTGSTTELGTTP